MLQTKTLDIISGVFLWRISKSHRPTALGIEAASFASGASKDIAESPTAKL